MQDSKHQDLVGFIWSIADKLRGPYRPPQYRRVMLPMIVLRRLDCVLKPTKDAVLKNKDLLEAKGIEGIALEKALSKIAIGSDRTQPLYNISPFTFEKLLGDPPSIATNLLSYINGFSPRARDIFEKFEFEKEVERLEEHNRLFLIIVPVERLPVTSASTSATFGSPLRPGCYAANLLTTRLFSDFLPLENEHRVLPESERVAVQGLQSKHHSQVTDDP